MPRVTAATATATRCKLVVTGMSLQSLTLHGYSCC